MSNSEINALENVVSTIFLPELCNSFFTLFEFLILEGAQAGLSWTTILNRRNGYRNAFCNFDVNAVSKFNQKDIKKLLNNDSIIRNKLKINSAVNNAKQFIQIQKEFGTFDKYL